MKYIGTVLRNLPVISLFTHHEEIANDFRMGRTGTFKGICKILGHSIYAVLPAIYAVISASPSYGMDRNPLNWSENHARIKGEQEVYRELYGRAMQAVDTDGVPGLSFDEVGRLYEVARVNINIDPSSGTVKIPELTADDLRRIIESYETEEPK